MIDETAQANVTPSQRATAESLESLLGEVAGEFFDQMTSGQQPQIEDYVTRYPEIAAQIRSAFPALQIVGDSRAESKLQQNEIDVTTQKTLGDFRILHELGRGGMGVVYEAEQLSMGRKVALKVLPFAALAQEKSLQRFRNEVRAAGSLNHPNIVPIYSVGEERGVHFFAMELIHGQTMAEVITQLVHLQTTGQPLQDDSISQALSVVAGLDVAGSADEPTQEFSPEQDDDGIASSAPSQDTQPETQARISTEGRTDSRPAFVRSAVRLGVQAAEALQHAHDEGVLHRDIKPGNLMLDAEGQLYITDFGLARIETDVGVTMTGDLVGTLRYMSPEQALAKRIVIDHRSDIYSLGVTLYELLTLRPPFDGEDRQELLKQIAFDDPAKPRQISRSIPHELETIVLKAIEKNPAERYATVGEMADDLRAFLEDRPIKAKPPTLRLRVSKWCTRNPSITWAAILLLLVVAAGSTIASLLVWREKDRTVDALATSEENFQAAELARGAEKRARGEAEKQERLAKSAAAAAQESERTADREVVKLLVATGNRHLDDGDLAASLPWFAEALKKDAGTPQERIHRIRMATVLRQLPKPSLIVRGYSNGNASENVWSPDGKRVITLGASFVKIWDTQRSWDTLPQPLRSLRIDADCISASFSPDGRQVVAGTADGSVRVWNADDGHPVTPTFQVGPGLRSTTFSADGQRVLSLRTSHEPDFLEARLWDAKLGKPITVPMKLEGRAEHHLVDASLSGDGRWVLTTLGGSSNVNVWDAQTGKLHLQIPTRHFGGILYSKFSPNGSHFLTTGMNGGGQIWDAVTGRPVTPPLLHETKKGSLNATWIYFGAFSRDGRYVATASRTSQSIRVFDSRTGEAIAPDLKHESSVEHVAFSPDGRLIAAGTVRGEVTVWDVTNGKELGPRLRHFRPVHQLSFSPSGRRLLVTAGLTTIWDLASGQASETLVHIHESPTHVSYTHDGSAIVTTTGYASYPVRIWDRASKRLISQFPAVDFASSHDDRVSVAVDTWGKVRLGNLVDGMETESSMGDTSAVPMVAISDNGKRAATVLNDGRCRIWDLTSKERLQIEFTTDMEISSVSLDNDGSLVAIGSRTGRVVVYDTESGDLLLDDQQHSTITINALEFLNKGKRLCVVESWKWRVLDLSSGEIVASHARGG